jgi:hypothetical protein
MAHRIGVCGSCRSRFQIPATFAPNRARCRSCGGVVEIGPAEGPLESPPAPPPARAPVVEAPAAPRPSAPAAAPAPALARASAPVHAPSTPIAREADAPPRKKLLVQALVVVGIVALLAIGLWKLFA